MQISRRSALVGGIATLAVAGCAPSASTSRRIGLAFETLQTEYWEVSYSLFKKELVSRGYEVLEAVADGDASRQLDQVASFLTRGVDGIIVAPKDAQTATPLVKRANRAGVPIVFYNRPPADKEGVYTAVQADNFAISKACVTRMAEIVRERGAAAKAMVLLGDLGDINAIERRDGFLSAVEDNSDIIEVVAQAPTDWNLDKARSAAAAALSANPGIDFIFSSSDFLFPALTSAMRAAGKYHKVGEPGHVILGGFDGDSTAYAMLKEGYLDADGVQDLYLECDASVQAIIDYRDGKPVEKLIRDEGFVIHQGNLDEAAQRMWGARA